MDAPENKRRKDDAEEEAGLALFARLPEEMHDEISQRTGYTAPGSFAQLSRYSYRAFSKTKLYAVLPIVSPAQFWSCVLQTQEERDVARVDRAVHTFYLCFPGYDVPGPLVRLQRAGQIRHFIGIKRFFCANVYYPVDGTQVAERLLDLVATAEFLDNVQEIATDEYFLGKLLARARQLLGLPADAPIPFPSLRRLHVHLYGDREYSGFESVVSQVAAPAIKYATFSVRDLLPPNAWISDQSPKVRRRVRRKFLYGDEDDEEEEEEEESTSDIFEEDSSSSEGENDDDDALAGSDDDGDTPWIGGYGDRYSSARRAAESSGIREANRIVDARLPSAVNRTLPGVTRHQLLTIGRAILAERPGAITMLTPAMTSVGVVASLIDGYANLAPADKQVADAIRLALEEIPWQAWNASKHAGIWPVHYKPLDDSSRRSPAVQDMLYECFRVQPLRRVEYAPFCQSGGWPNAYLDTIYRGRDGLGVVIENEAQRRAVRFAVEYLSAVLSDAAPHAVHALYGHAGASRLQTSEWVAAMAPIVFSVRLVPDEDVARRDKRAGLPLAQLFSSLAAAEPGHMTLPLTWDDFPREDIQSGWAETRVQVAFFARIWYAGGKLMVPRDIDDLCEQPLGCPNLTVAGLELIAGRVMRASNFLDMLIRARVPELIRADRRCARHAWHYFARPRAEPIVDVLMSELLARSGTAPDMSCLTLYFGLRVAASPKDEDAVRLVDASPDFHEFATLHKTSIQHAFSALAKLVYPLEQDPSVSHTMPEPGLSRYRLRLAKINSLVLR